MQKGAVEPTSARVVPEIKNLVPDEVAPEVLARAIVDIADAAKKLINGPLTERAIGRGSGAARGRARAAAYRAASVEREAVTQWA